MTDAAFLELDRLTRRFAGGAGVQDLSLSIRQGEIVALLGPSGSGKTTTLRLLAGFELPDGGRIVVGGEDLTRVPPVRRRIGMVFQHYALFPHLSVGGNVAFGLEEMKVPKSEIRVRVEQALAAVDLAGFADRGIASLSGGQQQRVALARALAPEPRILLLDEPLSNLDPSLRERTREELRLLIQRIGITTVLVTHEQEEAFDLADRIAVLDQGRLEQVDTPERLYGQPATPFVAGFVGRATVVSGTARAAGDRGTVDIGSGMAPLEVPGLAVNGPVSVAFRPEAFRLDAAGAGTWQGRVFGRRFLGRTALFRVQLPAAWIEVEAPADAVAIGDTVGLVPSGIGIHVFPAGR